MNKYIYTCLSFIFCVGLSAQNFCEATLENPRCVGQTNGRITVSPTGGSGGYTYMWGHTASTSNLQSNLAPGNYVVTVTDGQGASDICNYELIAPTQMVIDDIQINHPSCGQEDGVITFVVTPSVTADFNELIYSINGGLNFQSSATFTGLPEGDYILVVRDEFGCQVSDNATLVSDTKGLNATSDGGCTEADMVWIDVDATGGVPPYTYSWEDQLSAYNSTMAFNDDIPVGIFIVTVTDAAGCTTSTNISLTNCCVLADLCPAVITNAACNESDGSIVITPESNEGPFTYNWQHDVNLTGNSATNLMPGLYRVMVTDRVGCGVSCVYLVEQDCAPNLCNAIMENPECDGGDDGSITVNPTEGTAPFSYQWGHTAVNSNMVTGLSAGTYYVTITDANSFMSMCNYQINDPGNNCPDPELCNANLTHPDCRDEASGMIMVTPLEGTPPYSFNWAHMAMNSNIAMNLTAGDYFVTITDAQNFRSECSYTLDNPDGLVILNFDANDPTCDELGDITLNLGVVTGSGTQAYTGSTAGINYSIDGGNLYQASNIFTNLGAGIYNALVKDANNCVSPPEQINLAEPECANAIVGDFVWHDLNGNGVQEFNEPGLPNIQVQLFTKSESIVETTYTDQNGYYYFDEIEEGYYFVRFILGEGLEFTYPNNTANDNLDSDVDNSNGEATTAVFHLSNGEEELSIDAGMFECVTIGDFVWLDVISNEVQDPEENGINGLRVNIYKLGLFGQYFLYDNEYTGPKPNTPSDDGYYKFCVPPGTYYVEFEAHPHSLVFVNPGQGNSEIDSDIVNFYGIGTTTSFTVSSGQMKCDIDAGFYPAATIGDRVWHDENANGKQDSEESPIGNVKVQLLDEDGSTLEETYTDNNGSYYFKNLNKGDYFIKVENPQGLYPTIRQYGDEDIDSDIDYTGLSSRVTLQDNQERLDIDAGFTSGSVLPVEWLSFTAENRLKYNALEWSTAAEFNNDYFVVERRITQNSSFEAIGQVNANNSLNSESNYEFSDYNVLFAADYYYRIKQVDYSGKASYSNVVKVQVEEGINNYETLSLFPNPAREIMNVGFYSEADSEISIEVFNIVGQMVYKTETKMEIKSGRNDIEVNVEDLPKGVYNLVLKNKGRTLTENFIKM